jgi:hypothetical protein
MRELTSQEEKLIFNTLMKILRMTVCLIIMLENNE